MGWEELKNWKKWALIFFAVHLIISLILFNLFYQGRYNASSAFAVLFDFPLFILGFKLFPSMIYNTIFYRLYFPIAGSILYGFIGAIFGSILDKMKYAKS